MSRRRNEDITVHYKCTDEEECGDEFEVEGRFDAEGNFVPFDDQTTYCPSCDSEGEVILTDY